MTRLKSFYTLELFVNPGGARKANLYTLGSLMEVQRTLEVEFDRGYGSEIEILLIYGEDIYLCRSTI
jgi:hypothetical protein